MVLHSPLACATFATWPLIYAQETFIADEREALQAFLATQPDIPYHQCARGACLEMSASGRGVVIIGGRQHVTKFATSRRSSYYTLDALLAIASLRRAGCWLPIELWHDGDPLLLEGDGAALEQFSAASGRLVFRDKASVTGGEFSRDFGLSTLVLLYTSFEEVLFLDADVMALTDPTPLFDLPSYRDDGAVFWPVQIPHLPTLVVLFEILGTAPVPLKMDNAVMLINRTRHFRALDVAHFLNNRWRSLYFDLPFYLNGDADMFIFAWRALKETVHLVFPPGDLIGIVTESGAFCGHSIFIRHPNQHEQLVFAHRARNKFSSIPRLDLTSVAIKRSTHLALQSQDPLEHQNRTLSCFDMYRVRTSEPMGEIDDGDNSRETLKEINEVEADLINLRTALVASSLGHHELKPQWLAVLASYATMWKQWREA